MLTRTTTLPAIPDAGGQIEASVVLQIEADAIAAIPHCPDVSTADEWRRRAAALERYLKSREMQGPMRGAQRRIEARIGQLLGPAINGGDRRSHHAHRDDTDRAILHAQDKEDFRLLARALEGDCYLTLEEWRKSRRALVKLVRERLGLEAEEEDETPVEDGELSPAEADESIRKTAGYLRSLVFDPPPAVLSSLIAAMARASAKDIEAIRAASAFFAKLSGACK
jgi:hypothetical protein